VEIVNPFPTESSPTVEPEVELDTANEETVPTDSETEAPISTDVEPNSEIEEPTLTEVEIDSEIEEATISEVKELNEIDELGGSAEESKDTLEMIETVSTVISSVQLPITGDIVETHNYGGQTITDATIAEKITIANAILAGKIDNNGTLSNITVLEGATIEGGTVTGNLTNEGTVTNITFVGNQIEGGELAGEIIVDVDIDTYDGLTTVHF